MKVIEMMLQLALRITEMLIRISIELIVALLKGVGKIIMGLLGGLTTERGRKPERPRWQQSKPRKERRKAWARR